jgi:hypothetical protein
MLFYEPSFNPGALALLVQKVQVSLAADMLFLAADTLY